MSMSMSEAWAREGGFFLTKTEANRRRLSFPSLAQRNCNPGNLPTWLHEDGTPYPENDGTVDFLAWARQYYATDNPWILERAALTEGWRTLRKLLSDHLECRLQCPDVPVTVRTILGRCLSCTANTHAQRLAARLGVEADTPLEPGLIAI